MSINKKNNSYSVILPTFNEVGHIKNLVETISEIFEKKETSFEIIVVDDNSTDGTINEVESIKNINKSVNLIIRKNKKNSLVASLNEGIELSKYENIIWLDADFSHPPKYIEEFINYKRNVKNIDVIIFSRFLQQSVRYYKVDNTKAVTIDYLSIILNKLCNFFLLRNFSDFTSGYICIKKECIKNYSLKGYYGDYFINLVIDCYLKNRSIMELPFLEQKRASGVSKTTFNKIDFAVKCYFYIIALINNKIKLIKNKN